MHPKPKILILGHGRHGKDTLAEIIADLYGLTFVSSSRVLLTEVVWPALRAAGMQYEDQEAAYADRSNHRAFWKQALTDYNTPDKTALTRKVLEQCDMYVGMRCAEEYEASKHLFDICLWIHRPATPREPTMDIKFSALNMHPIYNHLGLSHLKDQARKVLEPLIK